MRNVLRHTKNPARVYMCEEYKRNPKGKLWNAWRAERRAYWKYLSEMDNEELLQEYCSTFDDMYYIIHEDCADARFIQRVLHCRLRKIGFL